MTLVLIAIGLLFSTNLKAQPSSTVTLTTAGNTTTITIDADGDIGCFSTACGSGTCITGNLIIDNSAGYDYTIPNDAFHGCPALEKVTFIGNAGNIGDLAFRNVSQLKKVTFYGNVGNIGLEAFCNCHSMETITFYGNVGNIGNAAFNVAKIKTLTFPGNVGTIDAFAFASCGALKTLTFCGDVGEFVGGSVFQFCPLLRTIKFEKEMIPPLTSGAGGTGNTFFGLDANIIDGGLVVVVPVGSLADYKSSGWSHIIRIIEPPTRPYILHKTKLGKGAVLNIGKP